MRYALIENNVVKDVFEEPNGFSIQECFSFLDPDPLNQLNLDPDIHNLITVEQNMS